uniref:Response regulatory domain-containing protein n=1 Tax=Bicosoecida sp. CB-2014 TaxID=1486930 RepID=A0A7S1G6X9_9STRA
MGGSPGRGSRDSPVPAGLRVLVAEDNRINQRVAQRMLEALGCTVVVADDGVQACERVGIAKPDALDRAARVASVGGAGAGGAAVDAGDEESGPRGEGLACDFDVLMCDVQMPEMDGLTATRVMRAAGVRSRRGDPLPIVAVTANVFDSDRAQCTSAGMDDFLAKPLSRSALAAMLKRFGAGDGETKVTLG